MNYGKCELRINGKSVGEVISSDFSSDAIKHGSQSFSATLRDVDNEAIQWELGRTFRMKKYMKQIFRQ